MIIKPFHQWKSEQVKQDSIANSVSQYFRHRDWYWKVYITYCKKMKELND